MRPFNKGDVVRSRVNPFYKGTYTVEKVFKTVVWVRINDESKKLYKGVNPNILELA